MFGVKFQEWCPVIDFVNLASLITNGVPQGTVHGQPLL